MCHSRQLIGQWNDRGQNQTYSYDAAGQLVQITDHALNQTTNYAYNAAGQHVLEQTVQAGVTYQNQQLSYDTLGRLAQVDAMDGIHLDYSYDNVGNVLHEHVTYDTEAASTVLDYGKVQIGTDESGNPIYSTDESGNPITQVIGSHVTYASSGHVQDLWSAYDAMNRQILADGALNGNASDLGNINSTQGHILSYDLNGNRISDTTWGTQVTPNYNVTATTDESGNTTYTTALGGYATRTGISTQWYSYDAMNRLSTVAAGAYAEVQTGTQQVQTGTDESGQPIYTAQPVFVQQALGHDKAIVLDTRLYDGASRVVQSGPAGSLPPDYVKALVGSNSNLSGATTTISRYDSDGHLLSQHVTNEANSQGHQIFDYYVPGSTDGNYDVVYNGYDGAGNVTSYQVTASGITTVYTVGQKLLDGYKEGTISAVSTNNDSGNQTSGTTTDIYDVNGMLTGVSETSSGDTSGTPFDPGHHVNDANGRTFVNDASGHVLQKTQASNLFKQLVVNGNVVGTYGVGVDPNTPTNSDGTPNFTTQGNFDLA